MTMKGSSHLMVSLSRDVAVVGVWCQLYWVKYWPSQLWVVVLGVLLGEMVNQWQNRWRQMYTTTGVVLRALTASLLSCLFCHFARLAFSEKSHVTWILCATFFVVVSYVTATTLPSWCKEMVLFLALLTSLNLSVQLDLLLP